MTLSVEQFELPQNGMVLLPVGAKVISVATVGNIPYVWALCNRRSIVAERRFIVVGTGSSAEGCGEHYGSFTLLKDRGPLGVEAMAFHVFEPAKPMLVI